MKDLIALSNTLDLFRTEYKGLQVQMIHVFITVALREEVNKAELETILNMPQGTVSRNTAKVKDAGLIASYPDVSNPKEHTVVLTPKGKQLASRIKLIFEKGD